MASDPQPSVPTLEDARRAAQTARRRLLIALRLTYLLLLATAALLPFVGDMTDTSTSDAVVVSDYAGAFVLLVGLGSLVVLVDVFTPEKRLANVIAIYFGVVVGLVSAYALSGLIDLAARTWYLTSPPWPAYLLMGKLALGITFCYLAVSIVLATKDDFRIVLPYVEFSRRSRGSRPLVVDTSVLVDARFAKFLQSGMVDTSIVVPEFVLGELQELADSSESSKRDRGRRGFKSLQAIREYRGGSNVVLEPYDPPGHGVDEKLVALSERLQGRLLTLDSNLRAIAKVRGLATVDLELASQALRPLGNPGSEFELRLEKAGEQPGQAVGRLPDGTLVVVEDAADQIGEMVSCQTTNTVRTNAGNLVFARLRDTADRRT
ncbi:MAG: PIN/TRAM domain-containing protein [Phycisphaerae bacterium]|nr:PIN/TRAM domain-containing protein [Phycisphaerae bacterium]